MLLDAETKALVEAGSATIVGSVDADGMPHACRAWGVDVVEPAAVGADVPGGGPRARLRLLLDAHEHQAMANLDAGRPVAITCADVRTLRSVQCKGVSAGVEPCRPGDEERMERFAEAFYTDIVETDGTPRTILDRLTPGELVAVLVDVTEVFDQTPGPDAGRAVTVPDPGGDA